MPSKEAEAFFAQERALLERALDSLHTLPDSHAAEIVTLGGNTSGVTWGTHGVEVVITVDDNDPDWFDGRYLISVCLDPTGHDNDHDHAVGDALTTYYGVSVADVAGVVRECLADVS